MNINFNEIEAKELVNFKGGEKSVFMKMFSDENNKVAMLRLEPGASIGLHRHEGNSEAIYIIEGNGEMLEEPYVTEKTLGDCDLEFPYRVPGTGYFVLGDQRSNSVDSRNSVVGAVEREDIIGKVFLRVWPLSRCRLF